MITTIAETMRNACGLTRCYLMASLCTELMELLSLDTELTHHQLRTIAADVEQAVAKATARHALMVNNKPLPEGIDIAYAPGFTYTSLTLTDTDMRHTESRLFNALMDSVDFKGIDTTVIAGMPYPLCELAQTLSARVVSEFEAKARHLQAMQQQHIAESHDPELQNYLMRTIQAGFMTTDAQWEANVTKLQIAYWVDCCARRLNISQQWKWAKEKWNTSNLQQILSRAVCSDQTIPKRNAIDLIFAD